MLNAVELSQAGQYKEARTLICSPQGLEEYDDVYKFLYRNLQLWGETEEKQEMAIVKIRDGSSKRGFQWC